MSQRDGLGQHASVHAGLQPVDGRHLGEDTEQLLDVKCKAGHVEVAMAGADVDEQVQVAGLSRVTSDDRAEHADVVHAVAFSDRLDLGSVLAHDGQLHGALLRLRGRRIATSASRKPSVDRMTTALRSRLPWTLLPQVPSETGKVEGRERDRASDRI